MMKVADIEFLVRRLEHSSIDTLEHEQDGARLVLKYAHRSKAMPDMDQGSAPSVHISSPVQEVLPTNEFIRSPATGVFLAAHPLNAEASSPMEGMVAANAQVGYLQVGQILSAVSAPHAGVLGKQQVASGTLVGYGAPIFEFQRAEEQA